MGVDSGVFSGPFGSLRLFTLVRINSYSAEIGIFNLKQNIFLNFNR